ncbi:hypothetical protein PUN28_000255 [Cardiocondyla obscurior]|uniref:Uncharacterized protein n=1 Tax=Cardiocondyla obscurior TaxID=286306 RepID=A0AAW2GYV8_9HYME
MQIILQDDFIVKGSTHADSRSKKTHSIRTNNCRSVHHPHPACSDILLCRCGRTLPRTNQCRRRRFGNERSFSALFYHSTHRFVLYFRLRKSTSARKGLCRGRRA